MKPRRVRTIEERLWSKVDKNGPIPMRRESLGQCWVWTAAKNHDGYGRIREGRQGSRFLTVSRVVLEWHLGRPLLPGMGALHHCDNPACCNPVHLYEGTHEDNERDMRERSRRERGDSHWSRRMPHRRTVGSKVWTAKLDERKVREIKSLIASGGLSGASIARRYSVTPTIISRIASGKIWKHVEVSHENV